MGNARLVRLLASICLFALAPSGSAQATIRPIPSVAHAWEARFVASAAFTRKNVPDRSELDLDFIGPLELNRLDSEASEEGQPATGFAELELRADSVGSSTFQGNAGSLSTLRGGWKVALGEESLSGLSYAIEVGTEGTFYDFGGNASPVPGVGDPFNDVYDTHLAGRFQWQRNRRLAVYGGVEVGTAGEDAVDMGDSGYIGGAGALRYEASPEFALLIGIAGVSRFDDSPWILPYVGFDWQVSERLRLKTEGAEVRADYAFSEDWSLGLDAIYDFRQYRLNESGPLNGGSFRDEEVRAGLSLRWRASDRMEFELNAGKMLWREVRFSDGVAGDLGETELSNPVHVGLGLKASF